MTLSWFRSISYSKHFHSTSTSNKRSNLNININPSVCPTQLWEPVSAPATALLGTWTTRHRVFVHFAEPIHMRKHEDQTPMTWIASHAKLPQIPTTLIATFQKKNAHNSRIEPNHAQNVKFVNKLSMIVLNLTKLSIHHICFTESTLDPNKIQRTSKI